MKKTNRKYNPIKLFAIALVCLALTSFAPMLAQTSRVYADSSYSEFIEKIEVSQSQFELGDLTSMPSSPSGWTNDYSSGETGNVVSGVLTLKSSYIANHERTKLDIYDEYKDKTNIPITPFGRGVSNPQSGEHFENTNRNVLMINTNKTWASFGYYSADISLSAHSFYSFSAWVKTGSYSFNEGAAITITGLKDPVGVWNIDTVRDIPLKNGIPDLNEQNNWGWQKFTIYVATGADSETVKLRLGVGDNVEGNRYFSNGYAFFDNIEVFKLSATNFYNKAVQNSNSIIYDNNSSEYILGASTQMDIGSFKNGISGWSIITQKDANTTGTIDFNTYNASLPFISENRPFGFDAEPFSPRGKAQGYNNILVLSSYQKDKDSFASVKAGVRSANITIEKETNYELSVWYNTQQLSGSANVVISGESTQFSTQYKITPVDSGDLTTNSNKERYGWQRKDIYIKGSVIKDVLINVELWLGYSANASGIAMFDDITLTKISSKEYNEFASTGTQVIIDSGTAVAQNVANGFFNEIDYADQEELKNIYPLNPTSWQFLNASNANWTGYSKNAVSYDDASYGVVPTNNAHFDKNAHQYGNIANPYKHEPNANKNVLLLQSSTPTIIGYRSDVININANSFKAIEVKLLANTYGSGVNLVIKNGDRIVSTIQNITSTNDSFRTYRFYVSGSGSDVNLTLEMWLGMPDKAINVSTQASGYVIFDSVIMNDIDEETLTQKAEEFNSVANMAQHFTDYAVYRLGNFDFSAFDRYSTSAVKDAYDFALTKDGAVSSGIIGVLPTNQTVVPQYFIQANALVEDKFNTTLYLGNIERGYSRLTSLNTFGLEADSCYKIEFSALVKLSDNAHEDAVGAGITLGSRTISDIGNTYDKGVVIGSQNGELIYEYKNAFNTFTFFYATSSEVENVEWSISLGSNSYPNEKVSGDIFINKITVTKMDSYYFDEDLEKLLADNEDAEQINDIFGYKLIDNRIETPTEDVVDDNTTDSTAPIASGSNSPWFLVPSILFGVAILVALFGVVIKKLLSRRGGRRVARVVSYDRTISEVPIKKEKDKDLQQPDVSEIFETNKSRSTFESFDDKLTEQKPTSKPTQKPTSIESEEPTSTTSTPLTAQPKPQINEYEE